MPIKRLCDNIQPVQILQILVLICCVGAAALLPTPSSVAHSELITPTYASLATTQRDLPAKRAEVDVLIGSRTSDGKAVTFKCQESSIFAISSTFADCIAPEEEIATTCAPNHQDTNSVIVDRALWCTGQRFTKNQIFTAPSANPLIIINCLGDYRLSRYVEATPIPINDATTSAGTATSHTAATTLSQSKSTPPESSVAPQGVAEDKGLSKSNKIAIGTSVPVGFLTLIGTVATVWMCRSKRRQGKSGLTPGVIELKNTRGRP